MSFMPVVSPNSAFPPHAQVQSVLPDLILVSSDGLQFHVHSPVLEEKDAFQNFLLPANVVPEDLPLVKLDDPSDIINIILHALYRMECDQLTCTLSTLATAIDRMHFYGINPKETILQDDPFHEFVGSFRTLYPLQTYILAARHGVESVAITCSLQLLTFPLYSISDEEAESMGPIYLKRLFDLQRNRMRELRILLGHPFNTHPSLPDCDLFHQQKVDRVWKITSTHFAMDAKPDISVESIEKLFSSLPSQFGCASCRRALRERIKGMTAAWASSKKTI